MSVSEFFEDVVNHKVCECGLGPGYTCAPDCPAYKKPPPAEITGHVSIANKLVITREQPALKASYVTVSFTADDTRPQQLFGTDNNRKRALVWTDALVIIGKREQLNTGATTLNISGARFDAFAAPIEITNQDELWVIPTGVAANISVINERWE